MRVSIVIGTYNERENLPELLRRIRVAVPKDRTIVVVDDASPDGTGALADSERARDPGVVVIHRTGKLGLGSAITAGIRRALELGCDVVVTCDADLSHPPEAIPKLVAALGQADVSVGSRYVRGGSIEGWDVRRKILSAGANLLTRVLTGSRVRDNTGNFRAFRSEVFQRFDLSRVRSEGYTYFIEMILALQRAGFRVAEVPIRFVDRRHGNSKIPRSYILQAFGLLLRLTVRRR